MTLRWCRDCSTYSLRDNEMLVRLYSRKLAVTQPFKLARPEVHMYARVWKAGILPGKVEEFTLSGTVEFRSKVYTLGRLDQNQSVLTNVTPTPRCSATFPQRLKHSAQCQYDR